jgi:uncharacterized cupredoxin-like copper-binding protein
MNAPRALALTALVLISGVLTSCSSSGGDAVAVTSTATECGVADTSLGAGKLTFEVANKGKDVTELYMLGAKDRVLAEVENVGPGTSRRMQVNLKAGTYTLACKPGQKGDGIRQKITVSGGGGQEGASGRSTHDREVEVQATEYSFTLPSDFAVEKGEAISFKLQNEGHEAHEFEVLGPDGKALGEVGPTKPGKSGEVVLDFDETGSYTYVCGLEDHEQRGMKGTFVVR